jgi:hypothetical protein
MALEFETSVVYECRGEANARVYFVAVPTKEIDDDTLASYRISGHVTGPTCLYSSTLQARIPLAHRGLTKRGSRTAIVAEAVVPDPCYWSTDLPFLYRLVGTIQCGEGEVIPFEQTFGMRDLRVVRNKFALNEKIWVPRAVRKNVVIGDAPLSLWRETETTMSVDDPDDTLLEEAGRLGVCILANLREPDRTLLDRLRRISQFPSVMVTSIDCMTVDPDPSEVPNLILSQSADLPNNVIAPWRRALILQCSGVRNPYNIAQIVALDPIPVIIKRQTGMRSLADARNACDELQADLAEICDPAGYIV